MELLIKSVVHWMEITSINNVNNVWNNVNSGLQY